MCHTHTQTPKEMWAMADTRGVGAAVGELGQFIYLINIVMIKLMFVWM